MTRSNGQRSRSRQVDDTMSPIPLKALLLNSGLVTDVFAFVDVLIKFLGLKVKGKVTAGKWPEKAGEYIIFLNNWAKFNKIIWCMYLGDDVCSRAWDILIMSKVKLQGRYKTENLVNTIAHYSVKGISPNFGDRCTWVRRWAD